MGVAFKLICALEEADGEDMMEYYGDVLAVGTIGDIVSLQGENRVIVKKGLEQLKNTGNIGLRTLSETCGIPIEKEESIPVSFGIVPRINAAGRIADPKAAVRLLLTDDDEEARMLSGLIDQNNRNRKELEEGIVRDIAKRLASDRLPLMERVVVLEAESWHQGVVGIVAAKLVNRYSKPCILISIDGEEACGSGRSVEGFSLIDAVSACSECLTHYGGHKMAAGFSLKTKDIGRFKELLSTYTLTHYPDMPFHSLLIDKELRAEELTVPNIAALKRLEPFGQGNPKPLFCVREAVLTGICELSGGKHLKLQLSKGGAPFYALLFGQTKREFPYRVKDRLDLAADCDINHYNGADSVSLKVKDLRLSGLREEALFGGRNLYDRFLRQEKLPGGAAASIVPTREDVAVVYRYLRGCGVFAFDTDILFSRIPQAEMGYCKMMMILEILEELGLIRTSDREIQVVSSPQKTNIEQSAFLQKLRQL
ncbi:single-stranded-DNA-specific exonuclease RecJ [Candidatus Soleaferrea massiliensis]|uniref:single-stranded-DNA-specific exonuclease RecJ n=1 Tax=Candidatus Soleaferrea massiliensis TaxID=1470354 RepID=UPI000694D31B|nr:DHHA1 domain-containing protein [Candidatus Soleaferrea massiliensis]